MINWPIKNIPQGISFWRVGSREWGGGAFNPNTTPGSNGGRFHPFKSCTNKVVPTLYMADHANGAFSETIMRRRDENPAHITINQITKSSLFSVSSRVDLRLIDLSHTAIAERTTPILRTGLGSYYKARTLAATLHASIQDIHGLCWNGAQLGINGMQCIVLFGDRFDEDDAIKTIYDYPLDRDDGLEMMKKASIALNFDGYLPIKYAPEPEIVTRVTVELDKSKEA